jgi:hypothetical protein
MPGTSIKSANETTVSKRFRPGNSLAETRNPDSFFKETFFPPFHPNMDDALGRADLTQNVAANLLSLKWNPTHSRLRLLGFLESAKFTALNLENSG